MLSNVIVLGSIAWRKISRHVVGDIFNSPRLAKALINGQMSFDEMAAKAFNFSSFTVVGHLIHINLKEHLTQHKHEIGECLLDKHKRAMAVVNKLNSIDNNYRNFDIEIIAKRPGCTLSDEELMVCEVSENKCRFKLDFSKVYWNSRLSTEHERIVGKLNKSHDFVFDLFAGVGPFSVPAAKAKCKTYANDLNPDSFKWLKINMERNKIQKSYYELYNMDAKDFILQKMKSKLIEIYQQLDPYGEEPAIKPQIHILMNLPALAPTFLHLFAGLLATKTSEGGDDSSCNIDKPALLKLFRRRSLEHIVYCYCFLKGRYDDPKEEVRRIIEENFGRELTHDQLVEIFKVRNVAPFKDMYRVELRLDEKILFGSRDLVGIMKRSEPPVESPCSTNGYSKKVASSVKGTKRTHDERSPDDSSSPEAEIEGTKRGRLGDYCTVM